MKYIWYLIKILIQCTWGCMQTVVGLVFFLINIKKPHYLYRGNIVTKWNTLSGLSMGPFMFTANEKLTTLQQYTGGSVEDLKIYANKITVHEYGHTFQSLMLGPFMLFPGLVSVFWGRMKKFENLRNNYGVPYSFCWVENWASRLGEKATGQPAVW